jgi:hypothetical protein
MVATAKNTLQSFDGEIMRKSSQRLKVAVLTFLEYFGFQQLLILYVCRCRDLEPNLDDRSWILVLGCIVQ